MLSQNKFLNGEYINLAREFAIEAHRGQVRKNYKMPYIVHLGRVVSYVQAAIEDNSMLLKSAKYDLVETIYDSQDYAEVIAAAYLHDFLEDVPNATPDVLALTGFTDKTIEYVVALTNVGKALGNRKTRKQIDNNRLANSPKAVKIIKLADRYDNFNDLIVSTRVGKTDEHWLKQIVKETEELLEAIKVEDCCLYTELKKLIKSV